MRYIVLLVINVLIAWPNFAQTLPVVKANTKQVSIRDGKVFQKNIWNLSPEIKPDVYQALEPIVPKCITFYTDIDSVSFAVSSGKTYDFLVVLNQKDTCYTRISTIKPVSKKPVNVAVDKPLAPALLQEDFRTFREALQKHHAGLYTYKSKQAINRLLDSCARALKKPMSPLEFGKTILWVISAIEDGHTGSNLPRLLMAHYNDHQKVFPLYPYFVDNKAYVLCGGAQGLPPGTELLAINGKPIGEIAKEIYRYLPSDGAIMSKKRQQLNDGAFPIMYHWLLGGKAMFKVKYKAKNGAMQTINLVGKAVKDFKCEYQNRQNNTKPLQLTQLNTKTALLSVKSFDEGRLSSAKVDFAKFLDSAFIALNTQKTANLIIDVRDNGGGEDNYGALLYSYLSQKPFRYFFLKASTTHVVKPKENPLLGTQSPKNNSFKGKVYILTNGRSFSTTADFCATARSNDRAIFIGEETGGGYYGNTSGGRMDVTLPNSQIVAFVPLFKYLNAVKKAKYANRGIIPDYTIIPSIDDLLQHKDAELAFALGLIK
ncbi:S41 family peptidase [Emticicia soli]|uniref:S41 family peptidase n=1 Tax=Emticicia soli TaxID=2027878 RepID=A0ABW5JC38_9BACT